MPNQFVALGELLEAGTLIFSHELFNEAAGIGDLALLVDVVVLDDGSKGVFVGLDHASNSRDMELIRICASAKVIWKGDLFTRVLRATTVDLHVSDRVRFLHGEGDHDGRDDLVADFRGLFHVAGNDVDGVPGAALDLIG